MKKTDYESRHSRKRKDFFRKFLRTTVLIIAVLQLGMAESYAQPKFTIHVTDATMQQVIKKIEAEKSYRFFYSVDDIAQVKGINLSVTNADIQTILRKCLIGSALEYNIVDNTVVIKKIKDSQTKKQTSFSGIVTDSNGNPMSAVTVSVKGTQVGTATDSEGRFSLSAADNSILVFSFIGMETEEILYSGQKTIRVVMKEASKKIEDIVITGYQTIKAHESTSSITTIKSEQLNTAGALSVDKMLEGLVPGMVTMNTSGTVGSSPKIRIRGTASIIGSREPVWVIDGLIYENPVKIDAANLNNLDNISLVGNAISGLNPENIERIDVLKDASSTAIYGVKAANGVIVITTKKGKVGKPVTSYSSNFQFSAKPSYRRMNLMNSMERVAVSKEIERRGLNYSNYPSPVGYEGLVQDLNARKIDYDEFDRRVRKIESVNTDWFDLLFRNSFSQAHNISISGGNANTTYYFSGGFNDAKDVEKGAGVKNYDALMRINTQLAKRLTLDVKLNANYINRKYNHSSINLFNYAFNTSRAIPVEENGERVFYFKEMREIPYELKYNILNELENTGRQNSSRGADLMANLNYNIIDGLSVSSTVGVNMVNTKVEEFAEDKSFYITRLRGYEMGADVHPEIAEKAIVPFGGELRDENTNMYTYTWRNQATFSHKFRTSDNLSVVVGNEIRSTRYNNSVAQQFGYLPERGKTFTYIDPNKYPNYEDYRKGGLPLAISDQLANFMSYYTAITYNISNRYVVNFNLRADGSNNFGQESNDKFLPVWSLSGKWNISEEEFLSKQSFINLLSLRLSYGFQGNVVEGQTPNLIIKPGPLDPIRQEYTSLLNSLPNPNLRWEKTSSYNVGLDFAILKNYVSGSVEYYQKRSTDLVAGKRVSLENGVNQMKINGSNMTNYGWELGVNVTAIKRKNLNWSNTFNISHNRNRITAALTTTKASNAYTEYLNGTVIKEGNGVDDFYAYAFSGLDNQGLPTFSNLTIKEGDNLSESQYFDQALVHVGSRLPLFSGGLFNNLRYKNLSLSLGWSFQFGNKRRMPRLYKGSGQTLPNSDQNMSADYVNRWKKSGDEAFTNIPSLSSLSLAVVNNPDKVYPHTRYYSKYLPGDNLWQMYDDSDLMVIKGDFLRLRSVTVGYTFPTKLVSKIKLQSASVRFQIQNLYAFKDKKLKSLDPEQQSASTMPIPTTYNLSLNLSF